jgi:hypothetical protein
MILGIDFDDTITKDENCWIEVIKTFIKFGHEVMVVTARTENEKNISEVKCFTEKIGQIRTIFSDHLSKKDFCEKLNIKIDIWIDDKPEAVVFDRTVRYKMWPDRFIQGN